MSLDEVAELLGFGNPPPTAWVAPDLTALILDRHKLQAAPYQADIILRPQQLHHKEQVPPLHLFPGTLESLPVVSLVLSGLLLT